MSNSDIVFEPTTYTIQSLVEHAYQVPYYQRPYSWEKDGQVKVLLEDIYNSYLKYKVDNGEIYFTGSFYYQYNHQLPGGVNCFDVIDGQQRITTFSLMLIALYSLAMTYEINDYSSQYAILKNQLWKNSGLGPSRELRLLELNSLDRDIMIKIFDRVFSDPSCIKDFCLNYDTTCKAEERISENFVYIYEFLEQRLFINDLKGTEPQQFLNYFMKRVQLIGIRANLSNVKIFEMFESINSKFKPLDSIDLIKTYIFMNINEEDYDSVLTRWTNLIKGTDDTLDIYLKVYIRAFISYYSQDISISTFKSIVTRQLYSKYNVNNSRDALMKLISELEKWLPAYKRTMNVKDATNTITSKEFEAYFRIFHMLGYEHPLPLLFKAFCDYQEKKIDSKDLIKTWKSSTLYMLKFKSINGGDSKASIRTFEDICQEVLKSGINADKISDKLNYYLKTVNSVTDDILSTKFKTMDLFSSKPLDFVLLALCQSINIYDEEKREKAVSEGKTKYSISKIDYHKVVSYLSEYKKKIYEVDHIMVQYPKDDDTELKYRVIKANFGNKYINLLEGHDFPKEINGIEIVNGMKFNDFAKLTINRIGNLRLITKHANDVKQNKTIYLDDGSKITTYKKVVERGEDFSNYFFNCPDLLF